MTPRFPRRSRNPRFCRPILALLVFAVLPSFSVAQDREDSAPEEEVRDLSTYFDGLPGTFVLFDPAGNRVVRHDPERARTPFLPASTFKIPNAAIALETGVASDADFTISWDSTRAPRQSWWTTSHTEDQTLRSAMRNSVVWYFQEIARRIGPERMTAYLDRMGYGNGDISAGIDQFWLQGDFRISADEQIEFLHRLYRGKLGLSPETTRIVRDIIVLDETETYRLSGKTGTGRLGDDRLVAWLVGYVERDDDVYFYALNLTGASDLVWNEWPGPRRVALVRDILRDLEVIE